MSSGYALLCDVFSLGSHRLWKRRVARRIGGEPWSVLLDGATGTGDWYSGALIVPDGKRTKYVHMGYGSSYERYQVLRIAAGRVVAHVKLSAGEFERYKAAKSEAFTADRKSTRLNSSH